MSSLRNKKSVNEGWPHGNQVAFSIRDDDISYFTEPWMLDAVYKEAWKMGFKVSLAVIPYVTAAFQRRIPKKFQGTNKIFPVTRNSELVAYLKEKLEEGVIDIVQHGCTHAGERGVREFAVDDFELLDKKLKEGRDLLRRAFNTQVNVFVAPHEKISRAAWKALVKNNMNLCRKFTLPRLFWMAFPSELGITKLFPLIFRSLNPFKPVSEDIIHTSKIIVIQWGTFLEGPDINIKIEEAKRTFEERLRKGGAFIIAHHYWEYFNEQGREGLLKERIAKFNEFLKYVHSKGNVWKTTLSAICSWLKETHQQ